MMSILKYFDPYSLKARVFPALIAGLPTLALLFVLVPWDHIGLSQVTAATVGVVLLFAFADLARSTGKKIQAKLGTGETPEQWYRGDPDVADAAKDRYRTFIARQLGLKAPTEEDERNDPGRANDFYRSAGNWLREHTRDVKTYALLFGENITYGYRRNLLGLKQISLVLNSVVLAVCGTITLLNPAYFANIGHIDEKVAILAIAAVLHSIYMALAVNATGVREASRAYGRQLILSCETLMAKQKSTAPSKRGKANAAG